jgi:hypothetical protein
MADFDSRMAGSILTADIPPDSVPLGGSGGEQDSATVAYVLAARPAFEMLKHAAAQLAAFFILATTGSQAAGPDHPLLAEARNAMQEATDGVRAAPGVTDIAAHHHRHLLRAAACIKATLSALQDPAWIKDRAALDPALHRLKAGWQELHWATAALPGFEMVQLSQSCCAHSIQAGHAFATRANP